MSETIITNLKKGPIVASLILAAFVALLSQTLLNVALPVMMEDLGVSENTIQWLTNGYLLVNGILIPVTAFLIHRFSTRRLFLAAVMLFALGTVFSALAPGFEMLLIGRIIQALGAGILMPLMTFVILTIFPVEERGKAMGIIGLAMVFAPAVGPTLSGWLLEHYSWRVLFYVVLPISILSLLFGFFAMRNVTQVKPAKLDLLGIVLSTLGFGGILYGITEAGTHRWLSMPVVTSLIIGGVSLLLFIWRELTVERPILEFRVFKYSMFSLTTLINSIVTMAMFSGMILLPIYLQTLRGFTPLESGLLLLPGAILMGIMSPIAGMIFDKIGARWLAVVGLMITAATTWEFSTLTLNSSYSFIITLYTLRMFGMSLLMMPIQTAGLNQLPSRLNAHGSAMSQTLRNISGALGTALLVTVMTHHAETRGAELMLERSIDPETDLIGKAQVMQQAMVDGINYSFVVAFWMIAITIVLAFFIRKVNPEEEPSPNDSNQATTKQDADMILTSES